MALRSILSLFRWLYKVFMTWWQQWTGPVITMDNGLQVRLGPQLAEGGFSFVFEATAVNSDDHPPPKYALKRIYCAADSEIRQASLQEAEVHRAVGDHPNVMKLEAFAKDREYCYMLFPLCSHSLRQEVNRRTGIMDQYDDPPHSNHHSKSHMQQSARQGWESEIQVLELFLKICQGVQAIHDSHYAHCDIKLENILLQTSSTKKQAFSSTLPWEPVLMDFGSAISPLRQRLESRHDCMNLVERASQHTTLPYRPPELLEGTLRPGQEVDFTKVDVWSLGCTLFAILIGASPMELEFKSSGTPRIVECTTLRILNPQIPSPPTNYFGSSQIQYESTFGNTLIGPMLQQDPAARPDLVSVIHTVQSMLQARGVSTTSTMDDGFADFAKSGFV